MSLPEPSRPLTLTPLLALALTLAPLLSPDAARAGTSPGPGLTYDPFNGLYLSFNGIFYHDPTTGYSYGPDLLRNYVANGGGAEISTSSFTEADTYVDTPVSAADHAYSTTLDALLGGHSVFSPITAAASRSTTASSPHAAPFSPEAQ